MNHLSPDAHDTPRVLYSLLLSSLWHSTWRSHLEEKGLSWLMGQKASRGFWRQKASPSCNIWDRGVELQPEENTPLFNPLLLASPQFQESYKLLKWGLKGGLGDQTRQPVGNLDTEALQVGTIALLILWKGNGGIQKSSYLLKSRLLKILWHARSIMIFLWSRDLTHICSDSFWNVHSLKKSTFQRTHQRFLCPSPGNINFNCYNCLPEATS